MDQAIAYALGAEDPFARELSVRMALRDTSSPSGPAMSGKDASMARSSDCIVDTLRSNVPLSIFDS